MKTGEQGNKSAGDLFLHKTSVEVSAKVHCNYYLANLWAHRVPTCIILPSFS